jgi:hypothetical protein
MGVQVPVEVGQTGPDAGQPGQYRPHALAHRETSHDSFPP